MGCCLSSSSAEAGASSSASDARGATSDGARPPPIPGADPTASPDDVHLAPAEPPAGGPAGAAGEGTRPPPRGDARSLGDARDPSSGGVPGAAEGTPGRTTTRTSSTRWRRLELVGEGAFGRVYRAEHVDTGEIAAVKVLAPVARGPGDGARFEVDGDGSSVPDGVGGFGDGLADDAAEAATHSHSPTRELLTRELEREAEILRGLHHANVIRFVDAERDADGSMCVVTEFVDAAHGGSIAASLRRSGPFGENLIRSYSRQILAALAYIHARGIVHRDVKGANVLIAADGVVKLADFGSATALERRGGDGSEFDESATLASSRAFLLRRSVRGTPHWMAPEVIRESGHGRSADIWSVGCVVLEMATGKPPWSDADANATTRTEEGERKANENQKQPPPPPDARAVHPAIAMFRAASDRGFAPPMPERLSEEARDFVGLCLRREPRDRPGAEEALRHPFAMLAPAHRPPVPRDVDRAAIAAAEARGGKKGGGEGGEASRRRRWEEELRRELEEKREEMRRAGGGGAEGGDSSGGFDSRDRTR